MKKISGALIATEVNDEEVDEELERFRLQRAKESGKEEQDAKEALVLFQPEFEELCYSLSELLFHITNSGMVITFIG